MKKVLTIFFSLIAISSSYAQDTDKFAKKVVDQMCDCIGIIKNYEDLKPKMDECYDKAINEAAIHANSDEIKIIADTEEFNKVKGRIARLIKTDCGVVKALVLKEAQPTSTGNPYPTNFDSKDFKQAEKKPEKWNGKIVAFDGEIKEVKYLSPNKPYLKVKMDGGKIIWVGSMVNSQYDEVGNRLRFLGYFAQTPKGDTPNDMGFHVLAFGEIDLKSKQLAMMPGSELQIKEWGGGQISEGK
jgi:hypothetical protein